MKVYSEYNDSNIRWIGEMPNHWDVVKIKHSDIVIMGQSPNSEDYNQEKIGLPFLQGNADFTSLHPLPRIWCDSANKTTKQGDVLLSVRAPIGAINISDQDYGIGRGLCAIRAKDTNPRLIFYLLTALHEEFNSIGTGSTYTAISADDVKNTYIPRPPITEQLAIADFLDNKTGQIDTLIEKKQRQIVLLQEQHSVLINQVVTKGLDPSVLMKDSGVEWLGEIPSHWEVKKLKYVGQAIIGLTYKPENVTDEENGTLVLRASNVSGGKIVYTDNVFVQMEIPEHLITKVGDILICVRSGSRHLIGKNALIEDDSVGHSFGAFMTVFRSNGSYFLSHVFKSQLFQYQSGLFNTSTVNQLTQSSLYNFQVAIPPEHEQKEITNYLNSETRRNDLLTNRLEREIELLQEYRTALISAAVTGKIDVRNQT